MSKAKPKPPVVPLHQLQPGQPADFFALLSERTKGSTRDGKPFYTCRFRDRRRTVSAMVWADSPTYPECDQHWRPGQFYKLRGVYGEHERYGPQIEIVQIRDIRETDKEDGFAEADFFDCSRFDSDAMFTKLRALAETQLRDDPLRMLVLGLLDAHAPALKLLPASVKTFYPFPGGWLEHTLSVTTACLWLADRYLSHYPELTPPLNRDLIVAGAMLHEIGRVAELAPPVPGQPPEQTVPGHLVGHLLLGRDLVRDAARAVEGLSPQLLELLEHILLSYLTRPEWGSPRLPQIPEVLILHHADDLDAKLEMYARCLTRDAAEGPFTERDPVLGKQLFKGRTI